MGRTVDVAQVARQRGMEKLLSAVRRDFSAVCRNLCPQDSSRSLEMMREPVQTMETIHNMYGPDYFASQIWRTAVEREFCLEIRNGDPTALLADEVYPHVIRSCGRRIQVNEGLIGVHAVADRFLHDRGMSEDAREREWTEMRDRLIDDAVLLQLLPSIELGAVKPSQRDQMYAQHWSLIKAARLKVIAQLPTAVTEASCDVGKYLRACFHAEEQLLNGNQS